MRRLKKRLSRDGEVVPIPTGLTLICFLFLLFPSIQPNLALK